MKMTRERLKEIGGRYGIKVEPVSEGKKGGFYMSEPDGSEREMSVDELMEMILPGSLKILKGDTEQILPEEPRMRKDSYVYVSDGIVPVEVEVKTEDILFVLEHLKIGEQYYSIQINGDQQNIPVGFTPIGQDGFPRILCDWQGEKNEWMLDDVTLYPVAEETVLKSSQLCKRIVEVIRMSVKNNVQDIAFTNKFTDDMQFDDLDVINFIMNCEDEFDIELKEEAETKVKEGTVFEFVQYMANILHTR